MLRHSGPGIVRWAVSPMSATTMTIVAGDGLPAGAAGTPAARAKAARAGTAATASGRTARPSTAPRPKPSLPAPGPNGRRYENQTYERTPRRHAEHLSDSGPRVRQARPGRFLGPLVRPVQDALAGRRESRRPARRARQLL